MGRGDSDWSGAESGAKRHAMVARDVVRADSAGPSGSLHTFIARNNKISRDGQLVGTPDQSSGDRARPNEDSLVIAVTAPLFIVPFAVPLVAITCMWRFIVGQARAWYSPLAFAFTAAGVDLLFTQISSHGSWSSWANSQMNVLPVLQSAALGGTPLVVFVVTLPAATVAVAIARRRTIQAPLVAYAVPLSLALSAVVYGYVRLTETPQIVHVPVGLVASDTADVLPPEPGGTSDRTLGGYLEAATSLAQQHVALVMLPEKIEFFDDAATIRVRDRLAARARDHDTRLVAGFGTFKQEYRDNTAWVFDRNGELTAQYSKQHLVPLLEMRYRPGEHDVVVDVEGRKFGIAICKTWVFRGSRDVMDVRRSMPCSFPHGTS
jgi:apolipoprotein N-acyltransferase